MLGQLAEGVTHRVSKCLNNIIEADHGMLKQLIRSACEAQMMKTACATIKGFEIMCVIRSGHCILREPRGHRRGPLRQQVVRPARIAPQLRGQSTFNKS